MTRRGIERETRTSRMPLGPRSNSDVIALSKFPSDCGSTRTIRGTFASAMNTTPLAGSTAMPRGASGPNSAAS